MKLNWGREPLALFVLLFASALAAAAFGTTLGTFIKTAGQAVGLSVMFGMLFAMMGGCMYPLELFPPAIQNAVRILPTTWAMEGMRLPVHFSGRDNRGVTRIASQPWG
jgi:ABC-2 type transport system permease protein